ncbi:MAG: hypothetical protein M2R45_01143 [Verrucomicrobia subdivision 3 bacterium]|nr:hypothetical protein [Limisphaerales bacterium]MCS1415303.1 hypothetical protein [Limisphaerales bacterium]
MRHKEIPLDWRRFRAFIACLNRRKSALRLCLAALLAAAFLAPFAFASPTFGVSSYYSSAWALTELWQKYVTHSTEDELHLSKWTLSVSTQASESNASATGFTWEIYYNRNAPASSRIRSIFDTHWLELVETYDNYSSHKESGAYQQLYIDTKLHWSRLAVDWGNSYRAEDGYGPFEAVAEAWYRRVNEEGEDAGGISLREKHTTPMGYESCGRLTWQPPFQTFTSSVNASAQWN